MQNTDKIYEAVSLFSGAGGLDLGFHRSGRVRTLACYEFDATCASTLEINRSKLHIGEARSEYPQIRSEDLHDHQVVQTLISEYAGADLVYGGPPCQSFSIMGKKGGVEDPRGALIFRFLEVVRGIAPRAFLFENVPHFCTINGGQIAQRLKTEFEELGYSLWSGILCAADFGAYTFRRRFLIIGFRGRIRVNAPEPTHSQVLQADLFSSPKEPWRTCKALFDEIEAAELGGASLPNHDTIKHSKKTIERFAKLAFGETDNVRKRNRLDPARPAHSVYVGGRTGKLQARTHIHPYLPRELTARECASIQGFPLDWKFAGPLDAAVLQSANAVPTQLAEALATYIASELDRQASLHWDDSLVRMIA